MARSTVIKAASVPGSEPLRLSAFRLDDVMREAEQKIAAARETGAAMIREAQAQVEAIRASARQEGLRQGHAEGLVQGREQGRHEAFEAASKEFAAQQAGLMSACRQIIDAIEKDRAHWAASARQDLVELAMTIARRVVKHVGEREREVVLANLEEAVRLTGVRSDVTIAVNPADAEAARLFAKSLLDAQEQWQHTRVIEEPEVSPGGCRVQWGSGAVDATLETQLERIASELQALRTSEAAAEEGEPA